MRARVRKAYPKYTRAQADCIKKSCHQATRFLKSGGIFRLFFLDFDNGLAAIAAALGANPVRQAIFAAVLAHDQMIEGETVMRTTFVPPGARDFAFWQRTHEAAPSKLYLVRPQAGDYKACARRLSR